MLAPTASADLADRAFALRAAQPGLRARDAAASLGVSEGAYVACRCGTDAVVRLVADRWAEFLPALPALGDVMALTRNEHAVHEKHGAFGEVSVTGRMGLVLGEAIDLRLFLEHWRHAFLVVEETRSGRRRSVQVFDAAGTAVHKIYERIDADPAPLDALVARFRHADQAPGLAVEPAPASAAPATDAAIDVAGFRAAWDALEDTHDFFALLRRFKVGRTQGLRLAGRERARPVAPDALRATLTDAAASATPIMVFVGNRGCIQIHSGPVAALRATGAWFNVLDPDFNLHLREDAIAESWIVTKPTRDGAVTSLELFDAAGGTIAMLFGKRKPGLPEDEAWRRILAARPSRSDS